MDSRTAAEFAAILFSLLNACVLEAQCRRVLCEAVHTGWDSSRVTELARRHRRR
jgi:hypothetical protein